jgi:hypothetical protein
MEVNAQFHTPTDLTPSNLIPVARAYMVRWIPELMWVIQWARIALAPIMSQILIHMVSSPYPSCYTEWGVPVCIGMGHYIKCNVRCCPLSWVCMIHITFLKLDPFPLSGIRVRRILFSWANKKKSSSSAYISEKKWIHFPKDCVPQTYPRHYTMFSIMLMYWINHY